MQPIRFRIEAWLNRVWYAGQPAPWWLRALVPLYRLGFLAHRALGLRRQPPDLQQAPIIVVGNLTAGGTGKTPLVVRLCRVLRDAGLRPGVVSRGYRGARRGVVRVTPESSAAEVGDEALLIARRTGLPVAVASDRCAAARALLGAGSDVIVADDGLQHHQLPRALEVCVVDGARAFGNGLQLPAGPLREPLQRLQRVNHVVVNTEDPQAELPVAGAIPMHLVPGMLRSLDDGQTWRVSQFAGCRANAVAGMAHPERFFRVLEQAGLKLNRYTFPDHHDFKAGDFAGLESELPLIMTEKDAVKCRGLPLRNAWYLAIEASLPSAWEACFAREARAAVEAAGRA